MRPTSTLLQPISFRYSAPKLNRKPFLVPKMDAHLLYTQQNPVKPTQQEISIATLPRVTRDKLAEQILATPNDPSLAIIDVRDSDFIGGHVKGCTNVPSNTLDYRVPELVRTLKDKKTVVFHCALSQVRGPSAALNYLRERQRQGLEEKTDGGAEKDDGQKVLVLAGGFTEWQEKYD
jgi:rhodanese-related sulfurtransferase